MSSQETQISVLTQVINDLESDLPRTLIEHPDRESGMESHSDETLDETAMEQLRLKQEEENKEANKRHYESFDLNNYELLSGSAESAIAFYVNKTNPKDSLVRIIWPDSEYPVLVKLPEQTKRADLLAITQRWDDIQHKVMIDADFLRVIGGIASRYNRDPRQAIILEGDPAVSKTFGTWVWACILSAPYDLVACSPATKESSFKGTLAASEELTLSRPLQEILKDGVILDQAKGLLDTLRAGERLDPQETALYTAIRNLNTHYNDQKPDIEAIGYLRIIDGILHTGYLSKGLQRWVDKNFLKVYEGGGIGVVDEINLADPAIVEALLSVAASSSSSWDISSQRIQGSRVKRHRDFFLIMTLNPPKYAGRNRLSAPMESRTEKIRIPPITKEKVENLMRFFMTGNDPEIRIKGSVLKGRRNVQTDYRVLETMPQREVVIRYVAAFHMQLVEMVLQGEIGQKRSEGGSYEYDQRKIEALLQAMKQIIQNRMVKEQAGKLTSVPTDWVYVVRRAIQEVYVDSLVGNEVDGERKLILDIIDAMPMWQILENEKQRVLEEVKGGEAPAW